MEQSLPIAANLLYQQASIVADAVLAEQRRTGSVPDVPADFQKKFYAFLDRINGHLMEDKDNFFGYFLFQMVKEIRFDMASPTGTNFKGTRYHLYFNPMLFLPLSPEQMESTIKHEILHVVSLHLIRSKELRQQYSKMAVNLAMDVVVNTYLDHLPPFSTTLEWVNMNYSLLLNPFESLEYYVDKIQGALDLRTDKKDLPESDSDSDESIAVSYDPAKTHDLWDEGDDIDEETLRKFTEKYIDASCKGELSNYLESMIKALKDSQEDLPWHCAPIRPKSSSAWTSAAVSPMPNFVRPSAKSCTWSAAITMKSSSPNVTTKYAAPTASAPWTTSAAAWTSAAARPIPRSSPTPIPSASTSSSTSPTAKAKKNSRHRPKATKSSGFSRVRETNSL